MNDTLPPRVLESLYQHRLLSSSQLQAMHAPDSHPAWMRRVLARLGDDGLVQRIRLRPPAAVSIWFLTEAGTQLLERSRPGTWHRRHLVSPEAARGPLQAHTLAANDVGIAFMAAARIRGHECGHLAWRHEVAHKLADRPGSVVCDLLLHYVATGDGRAGGDLVMWWFIEVDRGTMPRPVLVEKLQDYVALHRVHAQARQNRGGHVPKWVERYPVFPAVRMVFANGAHKPLLRRIRSLAEICRHDRRVAATELPIVFTTLEDLQTRGPFEPIFWLPTDPERPVDMLGRPADDTTFRRQAGPLQPLVGA